MIIDVILDRKDGAIDYAPETHLKAIYDYATDAGMTELATAVDGGTEDDVKAAVKALPFPPDDIFRGTGDGTREYTALFIL